MRREWRRLGFGMISSLEERLLLLSRVSSLITATIIQQFVLTDPIRSVYRDDYVVYLISTLNEPPEDVIQTAVTDIKLSTFIASLFAARLDKLATKTAGITWLAPTNQAFSRIGLLGKYLLSAEGWDDLRKVLRYNAIEGVIYQENINNGTEQYRTLLGDNIWLSRKFSNTDNTTRLSASGPVIQVNNRSVSLKGQADSEIIERDMLTETGAIQPVDGLQLPPKMNITIGKLLRGAQCSTFVDLLVKAKMDWLLTGSPPPVLMDSLGAEAREGEGTDLVLPYTVLAPTDEAFGRINLTYYLRNEAALLSLLKLHVISAATSGKRLDLSLRNFRTHHSYPLTLLDATRYSTLHSPESRFGDVTFRYDGHGSWLVGVSDARGGDSKENVARIIEGGQATPIWASGSLAGTTNDGIEQQPYAWVNPSWNGVMTLGGGVMTIDRVLLPYEPGWFFDWGYLALILGLGGIILLAAGILAVLRYRRQKRIKLEEGAYTYSTLEGEDIE